LQLQSGDINIHNTNFGNTLTPQNRGKGKVEERNDYDGRKEIRKKGRSGRHVYGIAWYLVKQRMYRQDWRRMKSLMAEPWHYPVTSMHLAASRVQSVVRRFLVKRRGEEGHPINVTRPSSR